MIREKKEELPKVTTAYFSKEFKKINDELRVHFGTANNEIEKVKEKVNELVTLVHDDNPKWSVKKICEYIAGYNDDLETLGFSARTIFNYLNEENRQLVDTKIHKRKKGDSINSSSSESKSLKDFRDRQGIKLQNNV